MSSRMASFEHAPRSGICGQRGPHLPHAALAKIRPTKSRAKQSAQAED